MNATHKEVIEELEDQAIWFRQQAVECIAAGRSPRLYLDQLRETRKKIQQWKQSSK